MIRVTVNNRGVQAIPLSPVTVGAEGIVAAFLFSDDWAGLAKTAIFKGSGEEVEKIVLNNQCTVPPEVLTEAGGMLQVGVYGNDGLGTLIRPTIWGVVGRIEDGAISEDAGQTGTTPSWAAQVQNAVQEALIVAQGVRTDADAGEFDGATFTPSVAADGTLSWTNDKEKENPQPVNIKGPQGPQGNPGTSGQDGVTPDFQIGSVETLNPGQSATATITGTPAKPVLNLGIPQGQKGDSGGGSGTSDYTQLSNKPQINGHTLSGNQSAADLGLGTYSKPSGGIPKTDLAQGVQQSLNKANSALQTAPVQSVAGKTGEVNLGAGDVGFDGQATYAAGSVGAKVADLTRQLSDKQNAPATAGTAGQVLGLDSNLNPAWVDQTGGSGGGMSIVNLSGTQITQVGADNTMYMCGELTELTFTAPSVGITGIRFTSGTTPTVLTVSGVTAWMFDFDPTALEASTTYEINVFNGIGVAGWT